MSTQNVGTGWTVVLLLAGSVAADAATVHVPTGYASIQAALNVSGVGDTVVVEPGTYSDYTIISGDAVVAVIPDGVVLRSAAGPEQTIIDMSPIDAIEQLAFSVVNHVSGLTVVDGFRITGGRPNTTEIGVLGTSYVEIRNCILEGADVPDPEVRRKGIGASFSTIRVVDCSFVRCSANAGAGINLLSGSLIVESCEFIECTNQAIRVDREAPGGPYSLDVRNSLFDHISAVPSSGGIGGGCIQASHVDGVTTVDGCVFDTPFVTSNGSGSAGAAISMSGTGPKLISNNLFHDVTVGPESFACLYAGSGNVTIRQNTMYGYQQTVPWGPAFVYASVSSLVLENNIVAHTSGAELVETNLPTFTSACNVYWDNEEGPGYALSPTDRVVDPQFCDPENNDYTLQATSPCLPELSLGCGLIGALGPGCGTISIIPESWGKIKSAYRNGEE